MAAAEDASLRGYVGYTPLVDLKEVDSKPLDADDDVFDVKSALLPLAAKWKDVGIALRLKPSDLDSIETSPHSASSEKCLSEMITHWLRKNFNVVKFGEPTWRRLVEVVMDPAGGANPALAYSIASNHKVKKRRGTLIRARSRSAESVNVESSIKSGYVVVTQHHEFVDDVMSWRMSLLMSLEDWFHGKISRQDTESKLANAPEGVFLVRESSSNPGSLVLSLKHQGKVKHRLVHSFRDHTGSWCYELKGSGKTFKRIISLVKHYKDNYISTDGEILKTPCPKGTDGQTGEDQSQHMRNNDEVDKGSSSQFSSNTLQSSASESILSTSVPKPPAPSPRPRPVQRKRRGSPSRYQSIDTLTNLKLLPSPLKVKKQFSASTSDLLELETGGSQLHPHQQMAYTLCQEAYKFATLPLSQAAVESGHSPVPTSPASDGRATETQQRERSATYTQLKSHPQPPVDSEPDGSREPQRKHSFRTWRFPWKRSK